MRHPQRPSSSPPLTPLKAPTQADIAQVTDILENRWSRSAMLVLDRYEQSIWRNDHNAAYKWALAGAINTDKILVLKGRPTDIVGHLHAHRHEMSDVMDKLAGALRGPVPRGTLPPQLSESSMTQPIVPVIDSAIVGQNVPLDSANDAVLTGHDAPQHGHELAK